jgi:hypothetical protein
MGCKKGVKTAVVCSMGNQRLSMGKQPSFHHALSNMAAHPQPVKLGHCVYAGSQTGETVKVLSKSGKKLFTTEDTNDLHGQEMIQSFLCIPHIPVGHAGGTTPRMGQCR